MFEELIKKKTDEELVKILANLQDYEPEFIDLVKKELVEIRGSDLFKEFIKGKSESNEWSKWYYSKDSVDTKQPVDLTIRKANEIAAQNEQARKDMLYGALWCIGGTAATLAHIGYIFGGAIVFGGIQFLKGITNFRINKDYKEEEKQEDMNHNKKDSEKTESNETKYQEQNHMKVVAIGLLTFFILHLPYLFVGNYISYLSYLSFIILIAIVIGIGYVIYVYIKK